MTPRLFAMLALIPPAPAVVTAPELAERLADRHYRVSARTVQRDLVTLGTFLPLRASTAAKPYGWSWIAGAACACCGGVR